MIKTNKQCAWFYNFDTRHYGIFLKPNIEGKQIAATMEEAIQLVMQGTTYLELDENLKSTKERLWVPEHRHKILMFPFRKLMLTTLDRFYQEYLLEQQAQLN